LTPFCTNCKEEGNVIIVDFHAETTSEKQAMRWYLDGGVIGVLGTNLILEPWMPR
tara:strand:- start:250 stop:414 length:165 start_codon:yes stop_codon:yes gene_type:complete